MKINAVRLEHIFVCLFVCLFDCIISFFVVVFALISQSVFFVLPFLLLFRFRITFFCCCCCFVTILSLSNISYKLHPFHIYSRNHPRTQLLIHVYIPLSLFLCHKSPRSLFPSLFLSLSFCLFVLIPCTFRPLTAFSSPFRFFSLLCRTEHFEYFSMARDRRKQLPYFEGKSKSSSSSSNTSSYSKKLLFSFNNQKPKTNLSVQLYLIAFLY